VNFTNIRNGLSEFPLETIDRNIVDQWILDALRDICENTWIYTEVITFLSTAGTYEYTLSPSDANAEVIGIPHDGVKISSVFTPVLSVSGSSDTGTLTPATTYSYQVTAYRNDYGETIPQTAESQVCPATGAIDLSWNAVAGADGYYIYGNNGSGTTYTRMTSTTDTSYTDDGTDTPDGSTEPPTTSALVEDIDIKNKFGMKAWSRYWRETESDDIDFLIYDGINKVQTGKIPKTSNIAFEVEVALKPTGGTTIPSILERNEETIRKFVRGRIYAMPRTDEHPWNDPKMAAFWIGEYEKDRLKIKGKKMFGHTGANLKAKFQKFA